MKRYIVTRIAKFITSNRGWIENTLTRSSTDIVLHNTNNEGSAMVEWPVTLVGGRYVTIGSDFFSHSGLRIECIDRFENEVYSPQLIIGRNVNINYRCHIGCINRIEIGNNVLIGSNVLITDHSHGSLSVEDKDIPWFKKRLFTKGPVIIEDNVWIGENVSIMPGVTIGNGSVIGANSVVTHDIPKYSMAAGNPALVIKNL